MGARELLADLTSAGFALVVDGSRLVIRPASRLTDPIRAALRAVKPELLALLSSPAIEPRQRPYRLSAAEADAAHAEPWGDAACGRFVARVGLLMRRGFDATDADDLADRLHLRDVHGDDRVLCAECRHYRPGHCGNPGRAGLLAPDLGRELAGMLQRCPGFDGATVSGAAR